VFLGFSVVFKKNCPKENTHPMGENSPNLVTLAETSKLIFSEFVCIDANLLLGSRGQLFKWVFVPTGKINA
jgi:hypothetical protein